jgi:peptidyl-prolyl cis-trans isomerase D
MAVIGRIRKHSTILLVVVALALLAFILGDFTRKRGGNKVYDEFIRVGDENISYLTYMEKWDQNKELLKENNGATSLTPDEDFRAGIQTYEELVDSVIFAKQTNYLGITVTPDELRDLVSGTHPHPMAARFFSRDGVNYDMQLAQQVLANMTQYLDSSMMKIYLRLENMIETETYRNKYLNLLTGAYFLPKAFAQKTMDESSMKADLELVQIPYSSELVSDDKISFTEEDIKKAYEANKYRFKQEEEYRNVEYVIFNIAPTESDLKQIEENVHQLYEEFTQTDRPDYFINRLIDCRYDSSYYKQGVLEAGIDTLLFNASTGAFVEPYIDGDYWKFAKLISAQVRPDSINFSFVPIAHKGTQNAPRKKEDSDKIIDTAYAMAMMGMDFYDIAKQYADMDIDQFPDKGRLWLADGGGQDQLFFDTLYMLAPGTIRKFDIPGVTYICKVNERTPMERKIRVAIGKKLIEASKETMNNIESEANNFVNGTDTYQKFVDAVAAHNLDKRTNDRVTKMTYTLPGIASGGREIIRWIYDEKTEKGTVSQVFALQDMYVVITLKDIYPEGYRTLDQEQVRNQIESIVKRDKKAEKLEALLKQSLSEKADLNAIATKYNSMVDTISISFADRNFGHYGPEPKVIGQLFGHAAGKTEIMKGDMGVYLIKTNKLDVPTLDIANATTNNLDMMIQQSKMMNQNRVSNGGSRALRKMYKITDNRYIAL